MQELVGLKDLLTQGLDSIEGRFDALDGRVDRLTEKVDITNGRVRQQEIAAAVQQSEIDTLRREMGEVRRSAKPAEDAEAQFMTRLKWVAWSAGGSVGAVLGLLKLVGKL